MQAHFDEEMLSASRRAEQLAKYFSNYYNQLNSNVIAIKNLTKLNRILSDELKFYFYMFFIIKFFYRCNELIKNFHKEKVLIRRSEIVYEINSLLKENKNLQNIKWFSENLLFKITDVNSKIRILIIDQLKDALLSLNNSTVVLCLKGLNFIYENHPQKIENELLQIMDEGVSELSSLFIQLNGVNTTKSSILLNSGDKTTKLLSQLSNKLHSYLEQYQLLGFLYKYF